MKMSEEINRRETLISPDSEGSALIKRIGILHHPRLPEARQLAGDIAAWLDERGVECELHSALNSTADMPALDSQDLILTLGGDGTILRAAQHSARAGVPLLGINLGRVGFLTEFAPQAWQEHLPAVLAGQFWIERRLMLHATARRGEQTLGEFEALNDVVVGRGARARVLHIDAHIYGAPLTTYAADGVIVATPTGSTAYALSAGGPILAPESKNILLTPLAPHLSLDRTLVLPADAPVDFTVHTYHDAQLIVDGYFNLPLHEADQVFITISPYQCLFARTRPKSYFFETLMEKLRWRM